MSRIPETIAGAGGAGANVVGWSISPEFGAWATGITAIGGAAISVAVMWYRLVPPIRAEAIKRLDEAYRDSLQSKVDELAAQTKSSNAKLHAIRNEFAAREESYRLEIDRLMDQVRIMHTSNETLHKDNVRLVAELTRLRGEVSGLAHNTHDLAIRVGHSGEIPAYRPDDKREDGPRGPA